MFQVLLLTLMMGYGILHLLAISIEPPLALPPSSPLILDRQGRLLRAFTVMDGRWRLPVNLDEVDPLLIRMLVACEDQRFFDHAGVDYLAVVRAAWQLARHQRIISGASTLSMQVARLLDGRPTRDLVGKARQMALALDLERHLDKSTILWRYLHMAPYGGNLEGIRAGSLAWLGKEPRRLTPAQAALLVALPQAPEAHRPDRHPAAAERARNRVLARALAAGVLDEETVAAARREAVPKSRLPLPLLASHATQRARSSYPGMPVQRLTLDKDLQANLEGLAAERAQLLGDHLSVALMVVDHQSGEILASIGSPGLRQGGREGFVDMTRAVRSPGSTLKPLIYGLAFEAGIAHPETLIDDRPTGFGRYVPANFDVDYQGRVTLRRALQLSLNIPAIKLLDALGPARLVTRLKRAGAKPQLPNPAPPGLAIGLGGVGLRLVDLMAVYGAIAHGGQSLRLVENLSVAGDSVLVGPEMEKPEAKPVQPFPAPQATKEALEPAAASGNRAVQTPSTHPTPTQGEGARELAACTGEAPLGRQGCEGLGGNLAFTPPGADHPSAADQRGADQAMERQQRVLEQGAAWQVTDILAGTPPPAVASASGLAYKTGTSYGYRDAWALGFDGRHLVGVWVGRPDGNSVPGLTGIGAAAPLLIDTFARLGTRQPLAAPPPGLLQASTARLPPPLRQIGDTILTSGPRIAFPPAGARLALGSGKAAEVILKVRDGKPPFTWFANGAPIVWEPYAHSARWCPSGPGFVTLAVVDADGRSNRVRVFLEPEP